MDDLHLSWDDVGVMRLPISGEKNKGKFVLVDGDYDGEYFATFKWFMMPGGHVYTAVTDEDGRRRNVYLHHMVCKPAPGQWIRHLNGDQLDCRSVNLKACSPSEVQYLRKPPKPASPRKYRGVGLSDTTNRWYVYFRHQYFGGYDSDIDAAKAYDAAAYAHYGDRAILNFPRARWKHILRAKLSPGQK